MGTNFLGQCPTEGKLSGTFFKFYVQNGIQPQQTLTGFIYLSKFFIRYGVCQRYAEGKFSTSCS